MDWEIGIIFSPLKAHSVQLHDLIFAAAHGLWIFPVSLTAPDLAKVTFIVFRVHKSAAVLATGLCGSAERCHSRRVFCCNTNSRGYLTFDMDSKVVDELIPVYVNTITSSLSPLV
jgi:hypothetical protein